jgi:predicted nucleotidyltransferase
MTTRTFTEQKTMLLHRIRETVQAVEPTAQIILYGSRARGDAEPDSDWDLLVLLDGDVTNERERIVRYQVYDLERETDTVLSTAVRSVDAWDSDYARIVPFWQNVKREGISL